MERKFYPLFPGLCSLCLPFDAAAVMLPYRPTLLPVPALAWTPELNSEQGMKDNQVSH